MPGGWVGGQISDAKAFRGVGVQYATGIIEIGDDDDPCPSPPEVFLPPPPPPMFAARLDAAGEWC